ncbi:MAG: TonB-dependent receptor [Bacteroidia bacterium]
MTKHLYLLLLFTLVQTSLWAQAVLLKGNVKDAKTGQILAGATINAESNGTYSDEKGDFVLSLENPTFPVSLTVSFIGYLDEKISVTSANEVLTISLKPTVLEGSEVVVTGSRVSETVQQSASSIQKVNLNAIKATASGDFYEGLASLKGVDMITSSLGFRAFNTRGFNTTSPVRVVQFIDGMDNQAPGLNFPVGNLVGATDLDLQSVEVITGPASALYGPNAFQGVISMTTKDPYLHKGLSIQLKGGNRNLRDGQLRYARTFGKKDQLAVKFSGSYMQVTDFAADDKNANLYGDVTTTVNLSEAVRALENGPDSNKYAPLLGYLDFYPQGFPGRIKITSPGYMESQMTNYKTNSLKLGGEVHYKIKEDLKLSAAYKYGKGTAVYQGTNRYSINNITFHQQKVELVGKYFTLRAYNTRENAGNSYDMVFTALNLSKIGIKNYAENYLKQYLETLVDLDSLDGNLNGADTWMVDSAHKAAALVAANNAYLQPGTKTFDSAYQAITSNANLTKGSKFTDASSFQHIEGQYNFHKIKWLDLIAGGNARFYNPQSFGTIFSDTLLNRADTLANGSADLKAKFRDLSVWEVGGYVQGTKTFMDNHLKITGSVRGDKNQNFKPQFSPRLSAVYIQGDHVFRVSAQSAFRIPTLQNQFILLTLATPASYDTAKSKTVDFTLMGNVNGFDNLYDLQSVKEFWSAYQQDPLNIQTNLLKPITLNPLKPEQVRTFEVGYRTSMNNTFFADAVFYYNSYKNFIGDIRVIQPLNNAKTNDDSGTDAILASKYRILQIPINSTNTINSLGATLGLSYYLDKGIMLTGNYSYAHFDSTQFDDDIIPGFNTPTHKVNLGVTGTKVWKGLGFSTNWRWQDAFNWQSPFGNGRISAYHTLDAQVNYQFEKLHSTLRVGGSNLLNIRYRTAFGSPLLGRLMYVSWTFEFDKI